MVGNKTKTQKEEKHIRGTGPLPNVILLNSCLCDTAAPRSVANFPLRPRHLFPRQSHLPPPAVRQALVVVLGGGGGGSSLAVVWKAV